MSSLDQKQVPIPPASTLVFQGSINHPDIWLWDSWLCELHGEIHLYCLAVSRTDTSGQPIEPGDRNLFRFHVRHFVSSNNGQSWTDKGAFFEPSSEAGGNFDRNIWSGSVLPWQGQLLFGFTGIRQLTPDRQFFQSICLAVYDNVNGEGEPQILTLSSPSRDYDAIQKAGYYLGDLSTLGNTEGEDGGPILSWRDPFLFRDNDSSIHLFWSAKVGPKEPAIAHAILTCRDGVYEFENLLAPITLPDAAEFTQAEVPKIYFDEKRGCYYMLLATCNRLYEGQPDREVSKEQRLYKSHALTGPWVPYHADGSILTKLDFVFGGSVLDADFETGDLTLIAPYTEMAKASVQLSFGPLRIINIYDRNTSKNVQSSQSLRT